MTQWNLIFLPFWILYMHGRLSGTTWDVLAFPSAWQYRDGPWIYPQCHLQWASYWGVYSRHFPVSSWVPFSERVASLSNYQHEYTIYCIAHNGCSLPILLGGYPQFNVPPMPWCKKHRKDWRNISRGCMTTNAPNDWGSQLTQRLSFYRSNEEVDCDFTSWLFVGWSKIEQISGMFNILHMTHCSIHMV